MKSEFEYDVNEDIEVSVTLSRATLNRLTHEMCNPNYAHAIEAVVQARADRFKSKDPNVAKRPYDPPITDVEEWDENT